MKYKRYLYPYSKRCLLLAIILLFIFSACDENQLTEKPIDFMAPQSAYTSVAGINQGINGLYANVRLNWYNGDGGALEMITALGTDLAYFGEDPGGGTLLSNYTSYLTPILSDNTNFWNYCYTLVQQTNIIIDAVNATDTKIWSDEAEKRSSLAEAMFFRAYAYRILVSLWGDVPLVTEVVNSAKTDFVRAPKSDVYKQIEQDLTYAAANLPEPGKEKAKGKLTQGAAWHLLSEIYLHQFKYQLAVNAASKVIDGYKYALMTQRFGTKLGHDVFGSGDVYYDLFVKDNQNLAENTEAIWVIQVEPNVTGGLQIAGDRAYGCAYFRMGNTPDGKKAFRGELVAGKYTGYSDTLGRPVAWCRPTNYLAYDIWRSDWKNDIRNAKHNIKRDFYFDNPESMYNKKKIDFSLYPQGTRDPIKDTCQYIFPYFMKCASPCDHYTDPARSGGGYDHKDRYAIRLAETLLLRAEGYLGLGQKDLAANDINKIRSRANAKPVAATDVTIDYILDERARELYTEEWRRITLVRLGKLVERVRAYNNNPKVPSCNIQDYNNLWPIPQSEIDLNVSVKMVQNPGY